MHVSTPLIHPSIRIMLLILFTGKARRSRAISDWSTRGGRPTKPSCLRQRSTTTDPVHCQTGGTDRERGAVWISRPGARHTEAGSAAEPMGGWDQGEAKAGDADCGRVEGYGQAGNQPHAWKYRCVHCEMLFHSVSRNTSTVRVVWHCAGIIIMIVQD